MPLDDPSHVARLMRAQHVRRRRRWRRQRALDRLHRIDDLPLAGRREAAEQGADVVPRPLFVRRELDAAAPGQVDQVAAGVGRRRRAADEAFRFEPPQYAAQIPGVEAQVVPQIGGGEIVAVRELVEHAHLGERVRTVEEVLAERADLARVEAVERADGGNVLRRSGHGAAILGRLVD